MIQETFPTPIIYRHPHILFPPPQPTEPSSDPRENLADVERFTLDINSISGNAEAEFAKTIECLTATASEDWPLVLGVCDRVSASESNAREAADVLLEHIRFVNLIRLT
ncbi:hypothetical protein P691DRAFT_521035 [Macrolepiota fuliginosa MF-IS2]|uniref:VHS domain-containing protein n=1 Tax=Macrolepiota fuliginosa MF-IS2 TaxID=1400762 RepID=A0A9P6BXQ2_9AGAR|nr:hypothetical protein P691DRAFT_521035 [Macrolepiota fuliginosa MF-IS2]